jgi:hypothetical protein
VNVSARKKAGTRRALRTLEKTARISGGTIMGVNQAPTAKGKQAAASLKQAAKKDERKTEARKGSDLAKGAKRFEERSKSSDGGSAGDKQRD